MTRRGIETLDQRLSRRYRRKFLLLAAVPLVLAVAAMAAFVALQSRTLAEREIAALERELIAAKKAELKNYISIARTAIGAVYGNASPLDEEAKVEVMQSLAAMIYGQDGYFFVFDYDGTNLVAPRQTHLINRNWLDLEGTDGTKIVQRFIELARSGGGYQTHDWPKPTTGRQAEMISYVVGFQDWRWALGTGIFIDDVRETVASARAGVEARVRRNFLWIGAIAAGALVAVFASGLFVNIRERSLADAALKRLTQRIIDTQEEERGRVARELHDGISQMLVSVRYALDLAERRFRSGDGRAAESLRKGLDGLTTAIQEVRRISRDLRPGTLDDLGLGPALKTLTDEFTERTGIASELETVVFRNRLDDDAKIALFRVAQEALTNIERHAVASEVKIRVYGHRKGATLRIQDDGHGFRPDQVSGGLGLRNMQERVEQLGGTFRILASSTGTVIEAEVPLTHLLRPDTETKESA
ncbi:histidine kinase [Silicimonas algicola]|uniref:Two-component system NarL family sensor kinase n=1 Tax=Silicimonas algicola TaxID=1826607 RepID=A0A316GAR7_9RHOB|nr:cache domain-containing protein [Silicimonas algicola]AZQ67885.1 histidine kinase [Silicimonas algicola]PWK57683.1 two-component system NarL family sensor kinase [Silicimonas algicola]